MRITYNFLKHSKRFCLCAFKFWGPFEKNHVQECEIVTTKSLIVLKCTSSQFFHKVFLLFHESTKKIGRSKTPVDFEKKSAQCLNSVRE